MKPTEINDTLNERVANQLNVLDAYGSIDKAYLETLKNTSKKVLNTFKDFPNQTTGQKILTGLKAVAGVWAVTTLGVTGLLVGGTAVGGYALWKRNKEREAFKKYAIGQSDLPEDKKMQLWNMSNSEFVKSGGMEINTGIARRFFSIEKPEEDINKRLENIEQSAANRRKKM